MNYNSYLCRYIKDHPNWREELSAYPYFIKIKEVDNFAIFNYNMLGQEVIFENGEEVVKYVDFSLPETQEARGIIIDTTTFDVVCWPFRKFGNYGESYVDSIDWNSAKVQEKIDGSIIKLYYNKYKTNWQIATNGEIDAFVRHGEILYTFGELFVKAIENVGLSMEEFEKRLNSDKTYIFELVSPYTKIIIPYSEIKVYHTGTRNNLTGIESNDDIGIEKPKEYELKSLDECIDFVNNMNEQNGDNQFDIQHEGFVVVDKDYHRIKIKSPLYLTMHKMYNNGKISERDIMDLIKQNETEEYLTYFPEFKPIFEEYQQKYDLLIKEITMYCEWASNVFDRVDTRKELANIIKNDKYATFAYSYIFNQATVNEMICNLRHAKLIQLIHEMTEKESDNLEK